MSTADSHMTRPGPDFDKYARAVISSIRQQGKEVTDETIEDEAERMAEMLVLDEQQLTEWVKTMHERGEMDAASDDAEVIGNIHEGGQ